MTATTTTLWRPCNDAELAIVAESGWQRCPPRLDWQPIFYPVLNEDYATELAQEIQVPAHGVGHVTRFEVETSYLDRYDVQRVGGDTILEYWIPAEDLEEFNDHIVGLIRVVATHRGDPDTPMRARMPPDRGTLLGLGFMSRPEATHSPGPQQRSR
ncbi:hypothetical protein [Enemella dayhoffiae]|uniref:hypothetical protein n=1 Tax=Enemella dayhoffiae TaxID=2016507 RepID=UPI001E2C8B6D|nr:hypothetical protein [Enemella dayhoffiae]